MRNAKWIADNLMDYGAQYVQIDDGWQGDGDPKTGKRDWSVVHPGDFPKGMDQLARYIKSLISAFLHDKSRSQSQGFCLLSQMVCPLQMGFCAYIYA